MERTYSPSFDSSPYGRTYAPRSRRSSTPFKNPFSFLNLKTAHLNIALWVVAAVLLIVAIFLSWSMSLTKKYSQDQIQQMYPKFYKSIIWSNTKTGKWVTAIFWILFVLTVLPIGIGVWTRQQEKRYL